MNGGDRRFHREEEEAMSADDLGREPTREEVDSLRGPVLLEFGASW